MDKDVKSFIDSLNKFSNKFIDNLNKFIDIDNLNKLQKIFLLISVGFLISALGAGGRKFESCHLDNKLESLFYRGFFIL